MQLSPNFSVNPNSTLCTVNDQMLPFTIFYSIIFLTGMAGIILALWAFSHNCDAKKCMNVYLTNLLVADFLLTFALPLKITIDLDIAPWTLKIFHCQCSAVLIYINMYASIIFLTFISVDRYLQIMQSSRLFRIHQVGFARMMSVVVWCLVLFIMVPNMAIPIRTIEEKPRVTCAEFKTQLGMHWHTFTIFLCMAIFLNSSVVVLLSNGFALKRLLGSKGNDRQQQEGNRKATFNIALVTMAYILCFVPYHVVRTPYTLTQNKMITGCSIQRHLFRAKESTLLLAVLHVCWDPILYFYLSHSFRQRVTNVFRTGKNALSEKRSSQDSSQMEHLQRGDSSRHSDTTADGNRAQGQIVTWEIKINGVS